MPRPQHPSPAPTVGTWWKFNLAKLRSLDAGWTCSSLHERLGVLGHLGWFSPIYVGRSRVEPPTFSRVTARLIHPLKILTSYSPPVIIKKSLDFFLSKKHRTHWRRQWGEKWITKVTSFFFKGVRISSIIPYFCAWGRMVLTFLNLLLTTTPWDFLLIRHQPPGSETA